MSARLAWLPSERERVYYPRKETPAIRNAFLRSRGRVARPWNAGPGSPVLMLSGPGEGRLYIPDPRSYDENLAVAHEGFGSCASVVTEPRQARKGAAIRYPVECRRFTGTLRRPLSPTSPP